MRVLSLFILTAVVSSTAQAGSLSDIKINEFMAANVHVQLNPDKSDFVDWIELYNSGDDPIPLAGLFLTDDFKIPAKWPLPGADMILPRDFFVIWADGLDYDNHASFKLSRESEQIGLFSQDGSVIDTITYVNQQNDISFGRYPDGTNIWRYFADPTFAASNNGPGAVTNARTAKPAFSIEGGLYTGSQIISLTADAGATIRYTSDGSLPTVQSQAINGPIVLETTTAICARAFHDNTLPSETVTNTYVINEPSTLPVICITVPPDYLFDEQIGIAVGIPVPDALGAPPPFDPNANFWNDWERPVHIEYYDTHGDCGFSQDAGIKIFGGFFGRQIRQKAFTLFARAKYGDTDFDYQLFPSKSAMSFKRFILRCSSNDFNRTYIRDAMMNNLTLGQMDVDWQAYQPAMVYINGIFWGLYNIREKTNQYYPESNYGIDVDDIDLIEGMGNAAYGDGENYHNLIDYVKNHDMGNPAYYDIVKNQIDMNELINYLITELYVRNHDWLLQNIKCWREHNSSGTWRWLLYDLDWGFSGEIMQGEEQYKTNSIAWMLDLGEPSILFQRLLQNEGFKHEFAQRSATHLNLTFQPSRVNQIIDEIVEKIAPEMPRQIERWGAIPSMTYWEEQLQILYEFAEKRPRYVFQHLQESFGFDTVSFRAEISNVDAGYLTVHDVRVPVPALTGPWLKGIPLRIKAHAYPGWQFVRWNGVSQASTDSLSLTLQEPAEIQALFEPEDIPVITISEIHYNPSENLQGGDDPFEFVELFNPGQNAVDLFGYYFSDGFNFTFPLHASIGAGETIVIAKTASTYAGQGFQVFQIESGNLANEGESLCLVTDGGAVVDSLTYDDHSPWPTAADGGGSSLELKDVTSDNSQAEAWRASDQIGGTPGAGPRTVVYETAEPRPEYRLLPNFPNPFNAATTITFDLAQPNHTVVEICNLRGICVATLFGSRLSAGRHSLTWNATNQSSGIYLVRLCSGRFRRTRKCILIK
jgi:hypothetical protein